jgi:hypothetical protein
MRRSGNGVGCDACGRGSHPRTREVGGHRPCPLRGAAFNGWTWTGGRRAKSPWSGPGGHKPGPEVRSLEQKSRDGAPKGDASRMPAVAGGLRSATCYPVAPFGASSPSFSRGTTGRPTLRGGAEPTARGRRSLRTSGCLTIASENDDGTRNPFALR